MYRLRNNTRPGANPALAAEVGHDQHDQVEDKLREDRLEPFRHSALWFYAFHRPAPPIPALMRLPIRIRGEVSKGKPDRAFNRIPGGLAVQPISRCAN